jgi:flagellar biosynthesis protein FliR
MSKRKNSKVPPTVRLGLALLIVGAITVGIGTMSNRVGLSIYGFIIVICGFFLYIASSFYIKRQEKRKDKKIK